MTTPATSSYLTYLKHVIRKDIAFNTTGIASGVVIGAIPNGAVITAVEVLITAAFNAATTNVLTVGTDATADLYLAAADVAEGSTGLTRYIGKAAKLAANTEITVTYTQTGTAATTGAAVVMVEYVVDPAAYT